MKTYVILSGLLALLAACGGAVDTPETHLVCPRVCGCCYVADGAAPPQADAGEDAP